MAKVPLQKLAGYCDRLLRISQVQDYQRAANGLQVENRRGVRSIAAAVDASMATVRMAIEAKADFLLVHHGLFWGPAHPWTGTRYGLMRMLLEHDLAVYSAHLPLDLHPKLGNNARLCELLGLPKPKPFFQSHGQHIGFKSRTRISRKELIERLRQATGDRVVSIPQGPDICRSIGVVSGGAGAELEQAHNEGVDTFISGEGPHWTYSKAEELKMNVLYGGHYSTETFGVKALAEHLSRRFRVPWTFIDRPTGL